MTNTPRFDTQGWWRYAGRLGDLYSSDVDGRTEVEHASANESGALRVFARVRIAGAEAMVNVPVVYRPTEPGRFGERPVAVVPGIALRLDHVYEFARVGVRLVRTMRVSVQSSFATTRDVAITLTVPRGLTVDSATRHVLMPPGSSVVLAYVLRGTPSAEDYNIGAKARVGSDEYVSGSATLVYDHIPPQRIAFPAATTIRGANVTLPTGAYVGYVASSIDQTARMLMELGLSLTQIDPASLSLPSTDLSRFSAIVVAPRVYETSPALISANDRLLAYARAGGTVVVQSGRYEMEQPGVLPFAITLGRPAQSVLEEASTVRVLAPTASVLTAPNAIRAPDFGGWVQDRAAFLPATFDPRWQSVIEIGDAGDTPNRGALLVAPIGRGIYIYTTLSFFRQFPAANVGAARLFVNLLAPRAASSSARRP